MNDTAQSTPAQQNTNVTQAVSKGATDPKLAQIGQKLQTKFQGNQTTLSTQKSSDAQKLDTLEAVLDDIQNAVPHGVVQAVDQSTNTLNPSQPVGSAKERLETGSSIDTKSIDLGGGVQAVETEKNPEIPVEVESFLQRVEDHHETAPTEVVIADGTTEVPDNHYPSKPVIVLPITQEEEQEGKKKSVKTSFRWLVEWSHKIVKMFTGKVIYKQDTK